MEHKLIQGGEQYLPFARSRIKALKATGLKYASQKFEIDGVSVKVRIAGEHEYIALSGSPSAEIAMDSGVFGMGSIAELSPATYQDGTLYEVGSALGYNGSFVQDTERGPGRWKPGDTSDGQFSGFLRSGKTFVGNILDQEAFKRPLIPDEMNEGEYIPDEHSELLRLKKLTATLCPASIFTGRTRLYVQALYGLPLSPRKGKAPGYVTGMPYSLNITGLTVSPSLYIKSAPRGAGVASGPDVLLTTSCGIWLDIETGEHWLFQMSGGCNVYPMKLRGSLKKLRKHLLADSELSENDKHRLETYLLSQSLPDTSAKQVASGGVSDSYSMGYGWHWNYSGTSAAVVEHSYSQWSGNPELYYTLSSLLEFQVKKVPLPAPAGGFKPGDTKFAWQGTLRRGAQVKWAGYRVYWVFAEPDFSTGASLKTFPKYHPPLITCSNAPIYVYYIGDEMKLWAVSISFTDSEVETIESDGFNGSAERTFGMQSGFRRTSTHGAHFDMTLTCGGYSSTSIGPYSITSSELVLGEKFDLTMYEQWRSNYYGIVGPPFEYTYVDGTKWRYGTVGDRVGMMSQSRQVGSKTETEGSFLVFVVPVNDSQAVFVHTNTTKGMSRSGTSERIDYNYVGFNFVRDAVWYGDSGTVYLPPYYGFDQISTKNLTRTDTGPYSESSSTDSPSSLYIGAVSVPCTFNNLGAFGSNDLDEVSSGATAWSSADTETPIVLAPGMQVAPVNTNNVDIWAPAIVGWV